MVWIKGLAYNHPQAWIVLNWVWSVNFCSIFITSEKIIKSNKVKKPEGKHGLNLSV